VYDTSEFIIVNDPSILSVTSSGEMPEPMFGVRVIYLPLAAFTVTLLDAVFPAVSVAVTVIMFVPSLSGMWLAVNPLPVTVAATPFTVTPVSLPAVFEIVPCTVTSGLVIVAPDAGEVIVTVIGLPVVTMLSWEEAERLYGFFDVTL
jgi:hypothetical protein